MAKKGRSAELIERRDAKILARFVYWTEVQHLGFEYAIRHMSQNEFFISEYRIIDILKKAARNAGDQRRVVFSSPKLPKIAKADMKLFEGEV